MSGGARSLWLPLQDRLAAWCVAALVLVCHVATMARDLTVYDSAELALAARELGLGHPPGQPLHTMVGWLFAHLPLVPPLVGLGLLSALPAALAVVPTMSLAEALCPRGRVARAVTVGLLSVHASLWETASRVEVYSLASLLAVWSAARLSAHLAQGAGSVAPVAAVERVPVAGGGWYATGLGLGLTAAVNPVIAALVGVAVVPSLVARRPPLRALGRAVLGGLTGLLCYLYVPLVGHRDPSAFVWGAPDGGASLRRFLSVADFARNGGVSVGVLARQLGEWGVWSAQHALLPVVVAGAAGLIVALRGARDATSFGLGLAFVPLHLGLTLVFIASNVVWLVDNPDYLGYLAAPLLVLIACAAAGASVLEAKGERGRKAAWLLVAALGAAALLAPPSLFTRTRAHDHVARMLGEAALDTAPPGAILIVTSDHWVFPTLWVHEAEARRPDVVVLPYGLASSSWYWEHLHRRHPELARVALTGPGGTPGRVRRLLVANAARPVVVERIRLAAELDLPVCAGTWLLEVGTACGEPEGSATVALEQALAAVGAGSPSSDAAVAQVAYDRGEGLWRLGHGASALASLLAGVPARARPRPTSLDRAALAHAAPLRMPLPAWQRPRAIGDPARNLFVASLLLEAAGDAEGARRHREAAAALGLPEATP